MVKMVTLSDLEEYSVNPAKKADGQPGVDI